MHSTALNDSVVLLFHDEQSLLENSQKKKSTVAKSGEQGDRGMPSSSSYPTIRKFPAQEGTNTTAEVRW
jgi:hypothetical protein